MREKADRLLKQVLGANAEFRPSQFEAIQKLVEKKQRLLVVERTGWGKSLVYFLATRLLRQAGAGPTLLISPLLALMRNQEAAARRFGLRAATIHSQNKDDWQSIEANLANGAIDVLLISPERLANANFMAKMAALPRGIGFLVVDEVHCISDWGHDFRPDYRRIVSVVRGLTRNIPVLGTTATANDRVVEDVVDQLGPGLQVQRGALARDSLKLQAIRLENRAERLAWLAEQWPKLPGTGIIYCLTVAECYKVSEWLKKFGIDAPVYYGKMEDSQRQDLEQRLLGDKVDALVSTVALGMGFDKPNLGFVVHFQRPANVVAYYQQVGRAGRAVTTAYGILLSGEDDDVVHDYFIDSALPSIEHMQAVLSALEDSEDGLSIHGILAEVNLSQGAVERILKLAELDGVVAKEKTGTKYFSTLNPIPDMRGDADITERRKQEMIRMKQFVDSKECLMQFVAKELNDDSAKRCGKCSNCAGDFVPRSVDPALVARAVTYLERDYRDIKPRKMWPAGVIGEKGAKIPEHRQVQVGRALGFYGDPIWARLIDRGKYHDGSFDDRLLRAVADMIRHSWRPALEWVTAVPSRKSPILVPDFAERLADALDLPYYQVLAKTKNTPPQKTMHNSAKQARNAYGAFTVTGAVSPGPVLLVDDVVNSGWTQTVCGFMLREAGSGLVYPVALATAAGGADTE